MNDEFLGTIGLFPYDEIPYTHMKCDGTMIARVRNTALFNLIGTTFGGEGTDSFGLPDLNHSVPIGVGTRGHYDVNFAEKVGDKVTKLETKHLTSHTHPVTGRAFIGATENVDESSDSPKESFLSAHRSENIYSNGSNAQMGGPTSFNISFNATGSNSVTFDNMQPSIAMVYAICVTGRTPHPAP